MKNPALGVGLILAALHIAGCTQAPVTQPPPTITLRPFKTATATATLAIETPNLPTPEPIGPTPTPLVHIVQSGETMLGIALRYGVDVDDLMIANPDVNPQIMSVGTELLIPGAGGDPVDTLLPTPTPITLPLVSPDCWRTPDDQLWCLLTARNDSGGAVESLTALVRLFDERGNPVQQTLAYPPLNLLRRNAALILTAVFMPAPDQPVAVSATWVSAVQASDVESRYRDLELDLILNEISPDRLLGRVRGIAQFPEGAESESLRLTLVLLAFDESGAGIGVRKWEADDALLPGESIEFDLTVFSLGPPIDDIDLLYEAQVVSP
jgi:LysM repeat protein